MSQQNTTELSSEKLVEFRSVRTELIKTTETAESQDVVAKANELLTQINRKAGIDVRQETLNNSLHDIAQDFNGDVKVKGDKIIISSLADFDGDSEYEFQCDDDSVVAIAAEAAITKSGAPSTNFHVLLMNDDGEFVRQNSEPLKDIGPALECLKLDVIPKLSKSNSYSM